MSKRKGGPRKKKTKTINLSEETHKALGDYAQRKNLDMSVIIDMFVVSGVEIDIYDPKWKENRVKAKRVTEGRASAEGACHRLATGTNDEGVEEFSCVAYNEEGVVRIKNLGKVLDVKDGKCFACGQDKKYKAGILVKDVRIRELETELGSKSSEVMKIPKCNRGAVLNHDKEDRLIMTSCFRHRGEPVSVDKFCRVQANGLPCMFFAELVVGVEGKKR